MPMFDEIKNMKSKKDTMTLLGLFMAEFLRKMFVSS